MCSFAKNPITLEAWLNCQQPATVWQPQMTMLCFDHLVVDASPFINRSLVKDAAKTFYTIPEVVAEIRDRSALEYFDSLPFKVIIKSPSSKSLAEIIRFAKLTGDFASLSNTDIKVVALALDLHVECLGESDLHTTPVSLKTVQVHSKAHVEVSREAQSNEDSAAENDDNGWITPSNIKQLAKKLQNSSIDNDEANAASTPKILVGCATNDFAAQNVLLQKGIKVVTYDGMQISSLKTFVLRCHTCTEITKDMSAKFCDACGRPTLIRTSYALDENGDPRIFLKENFQYKLRGTKVGNIEVFIF